MSELCANHIRREAKHIKTIRRIHIVLGFTQTKMTTKSRDASCASRADVVAKTRKRQVQTSAAPPASSSNQPLRRWVPVSAHIDVYNVYIYTYILLAMRTPIPSNSQDARLAIHNNNR